MRRHNSKAFRISTNYRVVQSSKHCLQHHRACAWSSFKWKGVPMSGSSSKLWAYLHNTPYHLLRALGFFVCTLPTSIYYPSVLILHFMTLKAISRVHCSCVHSRHCTWCTTAVLRQYEGNGKGDDTSEVTQQGGSEDPPCTLTSSFACFGVRCSVRAT